MLINNYNYNCQIMNNFCYQHQLYQQNMIYNFNYTNVNFYNQANLNFVPQNNSQLYYQNSFCNKPNIVYRKQNNKISNICPGKKIFSSEKKSKFKEEKEENKYKKINRRRRSSISTDTTTRCDSSFNNSIFSEDEKELEKEEGKKEIKEKSFIKLSKKNYSNYKKKLSNITEASNDNDNNSGINSESDNEDLENSFFSDTEIDDKEENKIEKGKKFEKKEEIGKFGKKELQVGQRIKGKKFENEEIFFENEKFEKKIEKNANENNISCKNKEYMGNPALENTEVLRVNVKLGEGKNAVFRLKRYDDVFETIKLFCEINSVDEQLIKPLIIKSLSTLNTIYQIMNSKVNDEQIKIMKKIKKDII